ncbi:MAG: MbcA/ParS/Xre antitoxin family protein [Flavihumibacter sp.]
MAVKKYNFDVLDQVPSVVNDSEVLQLLYSADINWKFVDAIKTVTSFTDEVLSEWLNVNVKTFREYKKPKTVVKENVKEQVLLLLSLFKHGNRVFGSATAFDSWLSTENFYLDNKKPAAFLNTTTGVRFIDDRLTAMEYGDNV